MPIQLIENPCSESICAMWHITEDMDFFLHRLNLATCPGFATVHHPAKQVQWLASRLLVKVLVEDYWHQTFEGLYNDEHGKPWLQESDCHISISNSNRIATAILHRTRPVGIDIELIKPKIALIASKFLTPYEEHFLGQNTALLTAAWCFKELVYKIHGIGNISLKDHIAIQPFGLDAVMGKACATLNLATVHHFELKYFQWNGYMLAYNYYLKANNP
jgi:4'-phosphopantetheinyl transferase